MKHLFPPLIFTAFFASAAVTVLGFAQEGGKGVAVEAVTGQKYAILIGINDYASLVSQRLS